MTPHSITDFEIQKYYRNKPVFNGIYFRDNLPKVKDRTYVVNLDEYESVETHCIALYVNGNNVTYFDRVEYISKELNTFQKKKNS